LAAHFVHIEAEMGWHTVTDLDSVLKERQDCFSCDVKLGFLHGDSAAGLDPRISVDQDCGEVITAIGREWAISMTNKIILNLNVTRTA
jgi:hypothetical protein